MSNPFRQQGRSSGISANAVQSSIQTGADFSDQLDTIDRGQAVPPESSALNKASGTQNEYNPLKMEPAEDSSSDDSTPEVVEDTNPSYVTSLEIDENRLNSNPKNPFAKFTSRTGSDRLPEDHSQSGSSAHDRSTKRVSKAMDVNSFKSLLLTGNAVHPTTETTMGWRGAHPSDSTSSTETSSISRYSLLENVTGDPLNTIVHDPPLAADSTKPKAERLMKKPPPPKSKHGKALLPRGPQTVSFEDFSPTLPTDGGIENMRDSIRPSTLDISRSSSKPLPTPPTISSPKKDYMESNTRTEEEIPKENILSQSKSAPPPPLARRSTVTKRPRANTTSSITSMNEEAPSSYPPSIAESTVSQKYAPPPPPARRTGSGQPPSTASHGAAKDRSSVDLKIASNSSRNRSSSQSSLVSPPPPPPARRRSSRSSLDAAQKIIGSASHSRRSSTEIVRSSFDSQRRTPSGQPEAPIFEEVDPTEKVQIVVSPRPPSSSAKDILADMDAFAEELEKFRNQQQTG
jgi:hypothetical protein